MKPILRFTLLFAIIITFTTCKKDDNGASTTLPEITQEGKNTMGFKINGKVWTPYFSCGSFSNPCGAVDIFYKPLTSGQYLLNFHFKRKVGNDNGDLIVTSFTNSSITTIGNKYDSVDVNYDDYSNSGLISYGKSFKPKGDLTITKIDNFSQIISGTFGFTLYNGNDSILITEGRFDYKFNACLCNN